MDSDDIARFFGEYSIYALVGLVIWAIIAALSPKKKKFNCDECGTALGTNPPFVDHVMGERVDFCSEACRDAFNSSVDTEGSDN